MNQQWTSLHRVLGVDGLDELQDAIRMFWSLEIFPDEIVILSDVTGWLFRLFSISVGISSCELKIKRKIVFEIDWKTFKNSL